MKKYWKIIILCISLALLALCVVQLVLPKSSGGNILHFAKIEKMAQHLNDKYGYQLTAADCTYFRPEDYSWHGDMLGFGATYNIPNIAAFDVNGELIVAADRKGVISDNGQLDEINKLLCDYFGKKLDLDIEYVDIRGPGNGNSVDRTINHILQYSFPQKITENNVADFLQCVWDTKDVELIFYFCEETDVEAQVDDITKKLKPLAQEQESIVSLWFFIRRQDEPLNLRFAEPDLNTEYLQHGTSSDHSDDYKFGSYYIANDYYKLMHYYVRAGICQLGRSYDSGLGSYERVSSNGWEVAVFQ